eukprot:scaffold52223_cov30-Tisochrysis_lutea.AAC.8
MTFIFKRTRIFVGVSASVSLNRARRLLAIIRMIAYTPDAYARIPHTMRAQCEQSSHDARMASSAHAQAHNKIQRSYGYAALHRRAGEIAPQCCTAPPTHHFWHRKASESYFAHPQGARQRELA